MTEIELTAPLTRPLSAADIDAAVASRFAGRGLKALVVKRSLDARHAGSVPVYRYRVRLFEPSEPFDDYDPPRYRDVHDATPVIVVGAGPAGLFASLKLLTLGFRPVILERGTDVHARKRDMALLSRTGTVNPDSNYCFGEGGAGAFSDGKLYTRSSKRGDNAEVLRQLVSFGASSEILFDAHPHIGSDRLPSIVENIRGCIVSHGGEYHFGARVCSIVPPVGGESGDFELSTADGRVFRAPKVILATGHSARDIYAILHRGGALLEAKGFALGVRVEHPQTLINAAQYHGHWRPGMPAAEYSFVQQIDGRGVFSFCMCPGGLLVPSSTEAESVVLNGMSNSSRSGKWANAGVVVQIEPGDEPSAYATGGPFSLLDFQRDVEREMYRYSASHKAANPMAAPAQRMTDFCSGRLSGTLPATSYHPGTVSAPLHSLLPSCVASRLRAAFPKVGIRGYCCPEALILGVESRTSSPVRIVRNPDTLECSSIPGLYPCGEGAGYSGGIVSSAIDGIRCALSAAGSLTECRRCEGDAGPEDSK